MKNILKILMMITLASIFGCKTEKELKTVMQVDLNKYTGKWYEIARLPNSFEKGLDCITAEYSLNTNGTIKVINRGHAVDNLEKISQSEGIAKQPNSQFPGKLKVSFFRPFWGKYYIFYLDDNYGYALVGTPSRKYFWILSREKKMDDTTLNFLLKIAEKEGFNTQILIYPKQNC